MKDKCSLRYPINIIYLPLPILLWTRYLIPEPPINLLFLPSPYFDLFDMITFHVNEGSIAHILGFWSSVRKWVQAWLRFVSQRSLTGDVPPLLLEEHPVQDLASVGMRPK